VGELPGQVDRVAAFNRRHGIGWRSRCG
jgi:hypothetical protein